MSDIVSDERHVVAWNGELVSFESLYKTFLFAKHPVKKHEPGESVEFVLSEENKEFLGDSIKGATVCVRGSGCEDYEHVFSRIIDVKNNDSEVLVTIAPYDIRYIIGPAQIGESIGMILL